MYAEEFEQVGLHFAKLAFVFCVASILMEMVQIEAADTAYGIVKRHERYRDRGNTETDPAPY